MLQPSFNLKTPAASEKKLRNILHLCILCARPIVRISSLCHIRVCAQHYTASIEPRGNTLTGSIKEEWGLVSREPCLHSTYSPRRLKFSVFLSISFPVNLSACVFLRFGCLSVLMQQLKNVKKMWSAYMTLKWNCKLIFNLRMHVLFWIKNMEIGRLTG